MERACDDQKQVFAIAPLLFSYLVSPLDYVCLIVPIFPGPASFDNFYYTYHFLIPT